MCASGALPQGRVGSHSLCSPEPCPCAVSRAAARGLLTRRGALRAGGFVWTRGECLGAHRTQGTLFHTFEPCNHVSFISRSPA